MPYAELGGVRTYYEQAGAGHVVVLVHGGCVDRRTWDFQMEAMARSYTVLRYDLRGHGRSSAPPQGYTIGDFAEDLRGLIQHMGLAKPSIMGHSLGGCVALEYAIRHPKDVTTLLLADTGLEGFPCDVPMEEQMARRRRLLARSGVSDSFVRAVMSSPIFDGVRGRPALRQLTQEMIAAWSGANWRDESAAILPAHPQAGRIAEAAAPALVLVGEQDSARVHAIAQRLSEQLRVVRKEIVPEAGHMAPMENPDVFNDIVLDFLGGAVGKALV